MITFHGLTSENEFIYVMEGGNNKMTITIVKQLTILISAIGKRAVEYSVAEKRRPDASIRSAFLVLAHVKSTH